MKTHFLAMSRISTILIIGYKHEGLSYTYFIGQLSTIFVVSIFFLDSESSMMEIYFEKEENRKEKTKWLSVLNMMPFFVMIYDKAGEQITYVN
jgi:hypothetical protein